MDEIDPLEVYAAPAEAPAPSRSKRPPDPELDPGPVLRRWERWRILYNAVLAGITLLTACLDLEKTLADPEFWGVVLAAAVLANACYCTGPFAEAYLYWLGVRGRAVGILIFAFGTLLSMFLALGAVLLQIDPSFGE
jgi:hypothetical protein